MLRKGCFTDKNKSCNIIKQIKVRLKNKRSARRKSSKGDAIDYYFMHKVAPKSAFEQLQPYHPMSVVAPKYAAPEELPPGKFIKSIETHIIKRICPIWWIHKLWQEKLRNLFMNFVNQWSSFPLKLLWNLRNLWLILLQLC